MELVHAKKAGKVDAREKVSSGNTDLFRRGMQALLRSADVRATAYKISWCSGIDTLRRVGEWPCHVKLRDESARKESAEHGKPMFIERDRREQIRNARGRRLEKRACPLRIELCSSASRVSRLTNCTVSCSFRMACA